jgi:hypothetical protein
MKKSLRFIILYFSILLHCIVQWVLQSTFPSACSYIVLVFIVSLHVSAYMAIFRCVGYFIFKCLENSASLLFSAFFSLGHTLNVMAMGSYPTGGMDVCKSVCVVLCVGSGLVTGWSPVLGVLPTKTEIVGSNPSGSIDVCVCLFCVCVVLCVGSGLVTGWSPVQGVLPTKTEIVGSNPTGSMDVFVCLFCVCVLCVGSGLATGWSPVEGVLRNVRKV